MGSELLYKPDWEEARQRYLAWWRGEKLDRCLLWVTAPKADVPPEPSPRPPADLEQRWTDLDYLAAVNDYRHRHTFYGAEAIPIWSTGYPGHATIPTFYGCPFQLAETTGWHSPILQQDSLDVSGLRLDRSCRWWLWGDESLRRAQLASAGKSIPSIHAIFGAGDTLAALRGTERLLYDMMDEPKDVRAAEERLLEDWFAVFEHQVSLVRGQENNYATWFALWAPGRFYPMHCDVSYGISPRTFREIYVPVLRRQAENLQQSIYHLDGTGAFHLVEEVCRIEALGGVQVLPGAGRPSPLHYLDVLRTVQRMDKRLHISLPPQELPEALGLLSSRGLCITTEARDESQARSLIDSAARLSRWE